MLSEVEKRLVKSNTEYETIDLYKLKYDPVLHEDEHYTTGNRKVTKQNKEFQKKISDSKNIILIYPMWWGSFPAILKGFFDRVLVSGFGFRYINGRPKGLLEGKKVDLLITTGGPKIMYKMFLDMPMKLMRTPFTFCGMKCKFSYIAGATELNEVQKKKISKLVKKVLKSIE